jgi:broad specificity phosphatase PhoE
MPESTIVAYVARHGQTTLNKDGCFRGNKNPPLDSTGVQQAHRLAKLFSNIPVSHIFCSDKVRATNTAEIIAAAKGNKIHKSESLRALNVGDFSGQKRTPESEAALQCYLDNPDEQIPGGESLNDFKSRIRPCIQEAIDLFMECGEPPLIVAHSSIVHEVGAMLMGSHKSVLVEPGGAIAITVRDGKLGAEPIFKPIYAAPGERAETVS